MRENVCFKLKQPSEWVITTTMRSLYPWYRSLYIPAEVFTCFVEELMTSWVDSILVPLN